MKRSVPLVLSCLLVAAIASPAAAQRRGNAGVNSIYGQFSATEMAQAGGDPAMASQIREQKQMMRYQQQMYKQQQMHMQQQAKQQEFLKKHPEAAKALAGPTRTTKKAATKTTKKDKAAVEPDTTTAKTATTSAPATTKTKKTN